MKLSFGIPVSVRSFSIQIPVSCTKERSAAARYIHFGNVFAKERADEYRIVQTRPKTGDDEPTQYINVPADNRFHLLRRFDLYEVLKRD